MIKHIIGNRKFCPYCGHELGPKEIKELNCDKCKESLTGNLDGTLQQIVLTTHRINDRV